MAQFEIFKHLDPALIAFEMGEPYASKTPAVWPSEASALRVDKTLWNIAGKCHRAAYMRMMGFSITNPADATSAWKWVMGREIESNLTEQTKMANIYAANGVKHFIRDITLSLEFDVITIDPADKRGWLCEIKSYSGYFAKKQIETENKPKYENLMQICLYLLEARTGMRLKAMIRKSLDDTMAMNKKQHELAVQGIPFEHRYRCEADMEMVESMDDGPIGAKLIYVDRGDASRKEFTIEIFEDFDGAHYPMVDGVPFKVFNLESIYTRYKTIQGYWFRARGAAAQNLSDRGILPPPTLKLVFCAQDVMEVEIPIKKSKDEQAAELAYLKHLENEVRALPNDYWPPAEYEWSYSPERIKLLHEHKEIGKTKFADYNKNKIQRIGDWQCSYCSVAGHCLKVSRPELEYTLIDLQSLLLDPAAEVTFG
jgi:hypothetical protein